MLCDRGYLILSRDTVGMRGYFRTEVAALHVELHGSLFQASVDIIWGQTQVARDILGSLALVDAQQTVAFGRIQLRDSCEQFLMGGLIICHLVVSRPLPRAIVPPT